MVTLLFKLMLRSLTGSHVRWVGVEAVGRDQEVPYIEKLYLCIFKADITFA